MRLGLLNNFTKKFGKVVKSTLPNFHYIMR
nr:MAG TPA: hypothetical protein [Caudoviricetes sp.]